MKLKSKLENLKSVFNQWNYLEEYKQDLKYIIDYLLFFYEDLEKENSELNDEYALEKLTLIKTHVDNLIFLTKGKQENISRKKN